MTEQPRAAAYALCAEMWGQCTCEFAGARPCEAIERLLERNVTAEMERARLNMPDTWEIKR